MKTVKEMRNDVATKFGFNHQNTIKFFKITEYRFANPKLIAYCYNKYMTNNCEDQK